MVWCFVYLNYHSWMLNLRCTGVYVVIFLKCLDILRKRDVENGLMFYLLAIMWISFVLITLVRVSKDS
jgi:hypothetical protein